MHKMDLNSVDLNYVASTLSAKRMAQSARLQHTTDWQTYILTHLHIIIIFRLAALTAKPLKTLNLMQ